MGLMKRRLTSVEVVLVHAAGDEIMNVGTALRDRQQRLGRKEDIIIHQERPVIHLNEQILVTVIVQHVSSDSRPLCHPIQPNATYGSIDMIPADLNINGAVELDAGHLRA